MGIEKYYIQNNHNKTIRNYFDRMKNNKVDCMKIARKFDYDFWDGERKFGYGGYNYIDNYWTSVAKHLIEDYSLGEFSKVLDVGCGKGFLLFELKKLIPSISISGFDISEYNFDDIKYNEMFDMFLLNVVGYERLNKLTNYGLFINPYAATSLREYFATGIEEYILGDYQDLQIISPSLIKKIKEIIK